MARKLSSTTHQRGFSLIEQIMVVVIIAALSAMAIPALSRLLLRSRLQTAQMDFLTAFQQARGTAVTTGKITLLCPTTDGHSCRGDNRWEGGWLLAYDIDRNTKPDDSKVLYVGQSYVGKLTIRSNVGRSYMRFHPEGNTGGTNLTLLLCVHGSKEPTLSVVVSKSGRIRGGLADKGQIAECASAK